MRSWHEQIGDMHWKSRQTVTHNPPPPPNPPGWPLVVALVALALVMMAAHHAMR